MSNFYFTRKHFLFRLKTSVFKLIMSLFILTLASCTSKKQNTNVLNLAIWNNYISENMKTEFEKETQIQLNIATYSSNEELLAKIQSGASGIDIAVPSDYMVDIFRNLHLALPIDKSKIPNIVKIDPKWLHLSFDPENEISLPYAWSTTGIAYNKDKLKKAPTSWADFYNEVSYQYHISLLDDVREVIGSALKLNHFSLNSTEESHLDIAKKSLVKIKPHLKSFQSDIMDSLLNEEVWIAQAFSTDALQATQKTNGKIQYVLPAEGGTLAVDNLVIPKGSKNIEAALKLINFLYQPEVNRQFVENMRAGPVVTETYNLLPNDVKNIKEIFPDETTLKKFEFIKDLKEKTKKFDAIWTQVKTEN